MHGGVDAHRHRVRVLAGDALVHLEEVAVLGLDGLAAQPLDRVGEVEVDAEPAGADAAALVADVLGRAGRDVAGYQVAERRVDPLQVVVAVVLGDLGGRLAAVLAALGYPDPAVVAQRLAHQRELALVAAGLGDAGRVDLRVAGVREQRALAVRPPARRDVAALGVGGQEEHVSVPAGGEHDGVREVRGDLAGDQVADDNAAGLAVDDDQLQHLVPGEHLDVAEPDLALHRLVRAEQQLLARLAPGVERARHLGAAEGAVVEQAAVLAGERHALRHALVDDVHADLGEPVHVGLAGAEVAALDRVVEEPVDRVAVVAVVLGGVDAALRGDRVRPPRAVLVAVGPHPVASLREGRRGRAMRPGRCR
nr:hypothetical protein GCM10020092_086490 [Actinoplanes digitatis]